ncbi:MAG TPA: nitroreductase family deazaflavin-dependent oxidoreductase [Sporichthyaceae bacterium]
MTTQVTDSPTSWVKEHIDEYVASGGAEGHIWNGAPTLLLTTTGRRSGEPRRTALIYGRFGKDYVVVASYGGSPKHPMWYLNLEARPRVTVQVEDEVFDAVARDATAEEREQLWPEMAKVWPDYDNYQTKTSRVIPVVILTRV